MNPKRWAEAKAIFLEAAGLSRDQQEELLDRRCGDDAELRAEVEALLGGGGSEPFLVPPGEEPEQSLPRSFGEFELRELLGGGGMGTVYRAFQPALQREVALKLLSPSLAALSSAERFRREGRAAAQLDHPGVARVYAVGKEDRTPWIAMELIEGHDVFQELRRQRGDRGASGEPVLPVFDTPDYIAAVARLGAAVASALQHAHGRGIVHRDVKPSNLLLDGSGEPHLVDFGLAKDEHLGSISLTGELLGTPYYMSPEQALAARAAVDHRTDVYSLGVVLYELLTLRRPFDGETSQEVLTNIRFRSARPIRASNPRVPRDLRVVVDTAMAREPADRYSSAGALADDLERFLKHQAIEARPASPLKRALRFAQRRRTAVTGVAAAVVLGVVGLGVGLGVAQARGVGKLKQELRERFVPREGELASLAPAELRSLGTLLDQLEEDGGEPARRLADELAGVRAAGLRAAEEMLAGAESELDPLSAQWRRARVISRLKDLALSFPGDADVLALLGRAEEPATLSVRDLAGRSGSAALRELDLYTGQPGSPTPLGDLPIVSLPSRPGHFRVEVTLADGAVFELLRTIPPHDGSIEALIAASSPPQSNANMVRFAGGSYTAPVHPTCHLGGEPVELEPFWIDEAEVTNADYLRFLRAHPDRQPPTLWETAEPPSDWLDRPVTGVSWLDARAYAEWVGKRLPTHLEWERAASGAAARDFPWGSTEPPAGAVWGVEHGTPKDFADARRLYSLHARPVRSVPEARTPEGLFHMLGNARELTESPLVLEGLGEAIPHPHEHWYLGGSWRAEPSWFSLRFHGFVGIEPEFAQFDLGFRCARTARR
ncbi:MAG: bifunctional serine/threonine-protein kinase/formylglycine-generating enzyme family protein [Planctomycetota bacterium]